MSSMVKISPPKSHLPKFGTRNNRETTRRLNRLLTEWNDHCIVCNRKIQSLDEATIEHLIPRSMGGKNGDNLAPSHAFCNHTRKTLSLIEAAPIIESLLQEHGESVLRRSKYSYIGSVRRSQSALTV